MRGWVIRGLRAVADLLLPRVCVVCGCKLELEEQHICPGCLDDMPRTRFHMLEHNPMADRFNDAIQRHLEDLWDACPTESHPLERYAYADALFFYDNESDYRHIPQQIKYHDNIPAGRFFGQMLGEEIAAAGWSGSVDVVIPVPLHWRRRWTRGYNHAEIIAAEVASVLGIPMRTDILKRTRHTRTQTRLDHSEKASNVRGAFAVSQCPDCSFGHVLLIDDVFTSGSTLMACFVALREVFPPGVRISVATLGCVGQA